MDPQFNEPLYNEVFSVNGILCPFNSKIYEKETQYNKTSLKQTIYSQALAPSLYRGSSVMQFYKLYWKKCCCSLRHKRKYKLMGLYLKTYYWIGMIFVTKIFGPEFFGHGRRYLLQECYNMLILTLIQPDLHSL